MKKLIYTVSFFLFMQLLGCTPMTGCIIPMGEGCKTNIIFEPNELPIATVGQAYYTEISISGGAVAPTVSGTIEPENNLTVEPIEKNHSYNIIKIYGIPKKAVDTTILIMGDTYGTMVSGKEFKKTYVLKVRAAQ